MTEEQEHYSFDFNTERPEIVAAGRDELRVQIGDFAGPLDLLLYLIKQEQANIFDIPIAKITAKYLETIQLMKRLDIAVAADFIVMAATLIEIKSKMLLPRDPKSDDEEADFEDPRRELVDRLLEYEKFKTAAGMLHERTTIEQATFTRGPIESDDNSSEVAATVFDLLTVFQKIVARHLEEVKMEIEREEISLSEMIRALEGRIVEFGEVNLSNFFEEMRSHRELVTAFIAALEIVRSESVRLVQNKTFGEILLRRA